MKTLLRIGFAAIACFSLGILAGVFDMGVQDHSAHDAATFAFGVMIGGWTVSLLWIADIAARPSLPAPFHSKGVPSCWPLA